VAEIVIAFGCEIRDGSNHKSVVGWLNSNATSAGTDKWTYPKSSPTHSVKIIYTKVEFAAALDQKDAVVIYDGHSRIGQGPAFGPAGLGTCPDKTTHPVNPWGDSFRMGYDFADIECIDDIMHHGTNPTEFTMPASSKGLFASSGLVSIVDAALKAGKANCKSPGAWRTLATCQPKVASTTNCRGDTPLSTRHYWRSRKSNKEFDTLVAVGDADLVKTKLACGVLFLNSCSSKRHFHAALARHKKAVKSNCMFFVTAEVCSANTTQPFLQAVLAGKDPVKDSAKILKRMNGLAESGFISLEK
jgi:hypothetical protein